MAAITKVGEPTDGDQTYEAVRRQTMQNKADYVCSITVVPSFANLDDNRLKHIVNRIAEIGEVLDYVLKRGDRHREYMEQRWGSLRDRIVEAEASATTTRHGLDKVGESLEVFQALHTNHREAIAMLGRLDEEHDSRIEKVEAFVRHEETVGELRVARMIAAENEINTLHRKARGTEDVIAIQVERDIATRSDLANLTVRVGELMQKIEELQQVNTLRRSEIDGLREDHDELAQAFNNEREQLAETAGHDIEPAEVVVLPSWESWRHGLSDEDRLAVAARVSKRSGVTRADVLNVIDILAEELV